MREVLEDITPAPAPQAAGVSVNALDYADLFDETAPRLIPSCLAPINDALGGGYQSHSYVMVNGPTKHGKSSLALMEARHKAVDLQLPTLIVSVEMRRREVLSRIASMRLPVAHQEVNRSYWNGQHRRDLEDVLADLGMLQILEFRRGRGRGVTVKLPDIFDEVKRLSDKAGKPTFVILDYTQRLLSRIESNQDPRVAMGKLSDAIAEATRDLGACFFVLSAIPRRLYGGKVDEMDDDELIGASAEGGGMEYDAGAVLFLRKVGRPLADRRSKAQLRITGQRFSSHSGEPIRLLFDGAHNLFEPADDHDDEDPVPKEILTLLAKPVHRSGLPASDLYAALKKAGVRRRKQQVLSVLKELVPDQLWCSGVPGARGVIYRPRDYAPKAQQMPLESGPA